MTAKATTPGRVRQLWLMPSEGPAGQNLVAEVAVNAPTLRLHSYAVPADLVELVRPGSWVRVPFGRGSRTCHGICVRVTPQPWDQTRPPVLEARPGPDWLSTALVELGLWVADYYVCAPWKVFAALVPASMRRVRWRKVTCLRATRAAQDERLTRRQAALLATLGDAELPRDEALRRAGVTAATLRTLLRRGLIEARVRRTPGSPTPDEVRSSHMGAPPAGGATGDTPPSPADGFTLTPGQQQALERIHGTLQTPGVFRVFLLFGVPGSGKTEVYVRAARAAVGAGRQVILLVPEIALTTQIVERLARRFGRVAVVHSQLPDRVRRETLAAIAAGNVDVVIGTRTAVFAPCPRLGLIIVDEEQESSFKNLAAPYYHARDVAIKRGQLEGIPVVLGSATPALETWFNASQRAHFELLRLPQRVPGARLPVARHVEFRDTEKPQEAALLSPPLVAELERTLDSGQQSILLHNRRGYAVYLRCMRCGVAVRCERCGSRLVDHRSEGVFKCHRCGFRTAARLTCPDPTCNGRLTRTGLAIQRLEEELRRRWPAARLLRLDSDTMRRREDYQAALARFEAGQADIMLGTQMVAKGLDFPGVRLVGVIDADAALSLPDFRAGERVFQLIVQVVGRAGRREGDSLALVQTGDRPAAVIRYALDINYESFAEAELKLRRQFGYPPYTRLTRLICADRRPGRARTAAENTAAALRTLAGRIHARLRVDGAEPCAIPRLREMARWQVLVRGPRDAAVQRLLRTAVDEKLLPPAVERFTLDVDPLDLL